MSTFYENERYKTGNLDKDFTERQRDEIRVEPNVQLKHGLQSSGHCYREHSASSILFFFQIVDSENVCHRHQIFSVFSELRSYNTMYIMLTISG